MISVSFVPSSDNRPGCFYSTREHSEPELGCRNSWRWWDRASPRFLPLGEVGLGWMKKGTRWLKWPGFRGCQGHPRAHRHPTPGCQRKESWPRTGARTGKEEEIQSLEKEPELLRRKKNHLESRACQEQSRQSRGHHCSQFQGNHDSIRFKENKIYTV